MKKRLAGICLAALLLLAAIIVSRAVLLPAQQQVPQPFTPAPLDTARIADHLSRAIQFKTVSYQDPAQFPAAEFDAFRTFLEQAFPRVHAALKRELISGHALLYTWEGSDPSLAPMLLIAHYDVVPVESGTEASWTHPPFAGDVADGFVWGRGAIDFKSGVTGTLEAVESLLEQGFRPKRTIYLGYGHDEELGGSNGAAQIAALLKDRGIHVAFSLDEGMAITQKILPGIEDPVALIGLAEKGYVSLELTTEAPGGHSSNPPPQTAIGILAAAIARLENHPMPARLEGPIRMMFEQTAPHMSFPMRVVMSNLWLFEGVLKRILAVKPAPNAAIRTTTAATIFQAGTKENVLPIKARAVVNFRILPGDSVAAVMEHVKRVIADDRITVQPLSVHENVEPSPISDAQAEGYRQIAAAIRQVRPEVVVAPGLTLGGTDSKNYTEVVQNLYRIQPMLFTMEDLARIHSTNERIALEDYARAIQTYIQVLRNAAGEPPPGGQR